MLRGMSQVISITGLGNTGSHITINGNVTGDIVSGLSGTGVGITINGNVTGNITLKFIYRCKYYNGNVTEILPQIYLVQVIVL